MVGSVWPGLRPPRPTPHGPPTSSGGREKWSVDGRRKWETERVFSTFSQRVLTTSPAQPVGGPLWPFAEGRRPGIPSEVQPSPTTPPEKGVPGGTSSPGGSFPHFFPRNGAPAGQAPVPRRSNGVGETPQRAPLREPLSPRSNGVRTSYIPHPGSHPLPNQKHRRAPQAPAVFFSARRKRPPQSPISRSRFTISTALRAQS